MTLLGPHRLNAPESSLHWNVAGSLAPKVNVTLAPLRAGPLIVICGGAVSTVHADVAVLLWLPEGSTAKTRNECAPSPSVRATPDAHWANAALSSEQRNVASGSDELNSAVKVGFPTMPLGTPPSATVGGLTSRKTATGLRLSAVNGPDATLHSWPPPTPRNSSQPRHSMNCQSPCGNVDGWARNHTHAEPKKFSKTPCPQDDDAL